MKIANFPFEMQTCTIIVTGWGLASIEMNLTPGPMIFEYYSANGEWDLQSYYTSNGSFSDGAKSFTRLFMHFKFRRKWQFYGQNLLVPIVLTSLLMCFVFMVPLESGEKIGYALTVLLS
ncbi:hypothetical protein V1264_006172 [Littorina saxatilis]|uniref:Neurotransmitter-gated ion-channel ligand-binding domain-containing protein n=1 Tax=Littorina saxatilis TaxID=31220 RepID=A0AAN9AWL9_9CAEN